MDESKGQYEPCRTEFIPFLSNHSRNKFRVTATLTTAPKFAKNAYAIVSAFNWLGQGKVSDTLKVSDT